MFRLKTILTIALLFSICLIFSGCGKPRIDLAVASQPNVNPDHSGRPSPVVIKMYEMRGDLAFKQSDFQTLFASPMQALGADLVAADEIVFVPSEAKTISYEPMPETKFVGIVAGFRQMDRAHWRIVVPVDPESKNRIHLELNDVFLTHIGQEQSDWTPEESLRRQQTRMTPQPVYAEPPAGQSNNMVNGLPSDRMSEQAGQQVPTDTMPGTMPSTMPGTPEAGPIQHGYATQGQTQQGSYMMPHSKRTP